MNELPLSEPRPWRSPSARSFQEDAEASFAGRSMDDLDGEIHRLVDAQERHIDDDCTNLYAGTNAPSPRLARLLGSSIGSRPNLGAPGDTYNRGMDDGSRLSVLCDALVGSLFAQVLRGDVESETLRAAVGEFRRSFTGVHFVSPDRTS